MTSETQWQAGYLLPDPIDGYPLLDVCLKIPDTQLYRAAFLGQLVRLQHWFTWEKSGNEDDTRARDAAEYWRTLLHDYLNMGCKNEMYELRDNPDDPCEVQQRHALTEAWVQAFRKDNCADVSSIEYTIYIQNQTIIQNEIYNRYDGVNPDSVHPDVPTDNYDGDGSDDRKTALCMALQSWVAGIASDFSVKGKVSLGLAAALVGFGWLIAGPLGAAVGAVVGTALGLVSIEAINAAEDPSAINDVVCCMKGNLEGASINFAVWQNALTGCGFSGGSNSQILTDVVTAELASEKNWTVFLDALGRTWDLAQAGVDTCPCEDNWSYAFMSANPRMTIEEILEGSYDAANNWYFGNRTVGVWDSATSTLRNQVRTFWSQSTIITRVRMVFKTVVNNPFTARPSFLFGLDESETRFLTLKQINTVDDGTYTLDTGTIANEVWGIDFAAACRSSGSNGDRIEIKEILIEGRGFDPFL